MNLKQMQNLSEKYINKFTKAATELVMDEVTNTDEENKKTIIMFSARDMAIGAALKRNEHILAGVGIGVVGTALAFTIGSKFRKKKDEVVVQVDMDELGKMEDMLKEHKKTFEEESAASEEVADEKEDKTDDEKEKSILDKINDVLKKPANLDDLKAVIEELRNNEK